MSRDLPATILAALSIADQHRVWALGEGEDGVDRLLRQHVGLGDPIGGDADGTEMEIGNLRYENHLNGCG